MTDGRPDPREPLEPFDFRSLNSVEEPRQLEAVVEKRITMDGSTIEIVGYEADDVVKILSCMSENMRTADAASWRAEG